MSEEINDEIGIIRNGVKYFPKSTGELCTCNGCAGNGNEELCDSFPICWGSDIDNLIFVAETKETK